MPAPAQESSPSFGGSVMSPTFQFDPVTPAANYTPYNSAIPGAGIYAEAEVMANRAYNNALAQINQNRLNTLTDYGYTGKVDPRTGVVAGVSVDPHSVYGKLQQLLHGQATQDQQALFQAEDHGLVGGLANQAQSELRYAHGGQDTLLGNDLQSTLAGFQDQQQQAAETRNETLWQAELAQLQAAIAAGAFNPASSDSPATPASTTDPASKNLFGTTDPGIAAWLNGHPNTTATSAKKKAQQKILRYGHI